MPAKPYSRRTASELERLFGVLGTLRQPQSVADLATRYSVSHKTIRRDVAFLRRFGFTIRETKQAHGLRLYRVAKLWPTIRDLMQ